MASPPRQGLPCPLPLPPTPTRTPHRPSSKRPRLVQGLVCTLVCLAAIAATAPAAATTPPWRAFHGATIIGTDMIIFGGTTDPSADPFGPSVPGSNSLFIWSTTLRQWSQPAYSDLTNNGGPPRPQKFLTSVPLASEFKMLSIVSNSSTGTTQGNLLGLDVHSWTWSVPTSPNPDVAPPSRLGAAVGMTENSILIHGGTAASFTGYAASTSVLNDLTKLDGSTLEWKSIANGPALMYHTMCKLTGLNKMVIFGGSDSASNAFNTVHTFDLEQETWTLNVPVSPGIGGSVPSIRKGHSATCLNNTMIVFGMYLPRGLCY
ncbi:hypothetical protein KVV02_004502 [Mortierella alpina]|uniref:Attractin/MKLN-like beta-propeller domain-containing protein n=1 Tax=Mortierella alpina TaxID=64518 RepID=A0A9P8A427_MORAP|nr:hypothetical protein KVV02_004502 [Mortierella alpina]